MSPKEGKDTRNSKVTELKNKLENRFFQFRSPVWAPFQYGWMLRLVSDRKNLPLEGNPVEGNALNSGILFKSGGLQDRTLNV